MLRPIIMIGCGGSGQKAVRYVRDAVKRHLEHNGWKGGFPQAWQFLGVDTLTSQEDQTIPPFPAKDYISVSLDFPTFQGLNTALEAQFSPILQPKAFRELQGWRPNPTEVKVPLREGAGQLRAVGRSAGVLALQEIVKERLKFAFTECAAGGPQLVALCKHLSIEVPPGVSVKDPIILIVGSMAGGTGAGIMLDVVDLVRRTDSQGQFPVLVAFTPDIFPPQVRAGGMMANAAAFMSELLSAYWDNEATDSELVPATVKVDTRGPHSVFMIGRRNIDGLDLQNSNNVYRAVGEALAAVTTSPAVQEQFFNFITTNWEPFATANAGGYGFHAAQMKGVVSSFGSVTVSIGRDRFRDYVKRLLERSIIEYLADGYEMVATSVLGDAAKSMAGAAKIAELTRRNLDQFIVACGLSESDEGVKQISGRFVSNDIMKQRLSQVANNVRLPFAAASQMGGAQWLQTIFSQAQQVKVAELSSVDSQLDLELREWGTEVLLKTLRAATEYAGTLSLPVLQSLLQATQTQVQTASAKMREEAKTASTSADKALEKARTHLSSAGKGSLAMSAAPVQDTIQDVSKAIVLEWASRTRLGLAVALESVATVLLAGVSASVNQSIGRLNLLMKPKDGKEPLIKDWPKNDGVVPNVFAPSPVEFFLESHSEWPEMAKQLLARSIGDTAGLPIDPVDAARLLIVRGNFGGDDSTPPVKPFVWSLGYGSDPVWKPGQQIDLVLADDPSVLSERVDTWLTRPATEMFYALSEGLSSYLMTKHFKTGAAIPDHQERLMAFQEKLRAALQQSRPLIQIDNVMNSTVHGKKLEYTLNISGFPFGGNHPARAICEQEIQGFLKTPQDVNKFFSSGDEESVLISNFLKYPVHPSVLTSFTEPLNEALEEIKDPSLLRSAFWQWRRSRILENYIPLPDELRIAAIRGFAIARIIGTATANAGGQNQISSKEGVFDFPRYLLTETDKNNLLPCLLEAMVLTFAACPTRGKGAFDAYAALIEYGTGGGRGAGFEIDGVTAEIFRSGNYSGIQILDQARANALQSDPNGRVSNAISAIDKVIVRYDEIDTRPLDPKSWRNQVGSVDPVDTLSRELITDLRRGYVMVREALEKFQRALTTGDDEEGL